MTSLVYTCCPERMLDASVSGLLTVPVVGLGAFLDTFFTTTTLFSIVNTSLLLYLNPKSPS